MSESQRIVAHTAHGDVIQVPGPADSGTVIRFPTVCTLGDLEDAHQPQKTDSGDPGPSRISVSGTRLKSLLTDPGDYSVIAPGTGRDFNAFSVDDFQKEVKRMWGHEWDLAPATVLLAALIMQMRRRVVGNSNFVSSEGAVLHTFDAQSSGPRIEVFQPSEALGITKVISHYVAACKRITNA